MNHENCPVIVQYEDNLKQPICTSPAPDEILVIGPAHRIRRSSLADHVFRLVRINTVLRQMLDVPVVPAKLHDDSTSRFTNGILIYIKYRCNPLGEQCSPAAGTRPAKRRSTIGRPGDGDKKAASAERSTLRIGSKRRQ
jgi:hypothetical protein